MSLEAQLQSATSAFQKFQSEISKAVATRQSLDAQLAENTAVLKELDAVQDVAGCTVYKLAGPVLVKQDQEEARANVDRRVEFLSGEIKRVQERLSASQSSLEAKKLELVHLQSQLQHQQAAQQAPGSSAQPIAMEA